MRDKTQRIIFETIRRAVKREVGREVKRLRLCVVNEVTKVKPVIEDLNGVTEPSPHSIWAVDENDIHDNGIES